MMRGNGPIGEEGSSIPGRGNGRCKGEMSLAETGKAEEACESGAERVKGRKKRVRSGRWVSPVGCGFYSYKNGSAD